MNMAHKISDSIVAFAADAAFQGLTKSARKAMTHETPVPFHPDLRAKKVDSLSKADNAGVDPSVVIDFVRRAMSSVGNASHCALTDRRKSCY